MRKPDSLGRLACAGAGPLRVRLIVRLGCRYRRHRRTTDR